LNQLSLLVIALSCCAAKTNGDITRTCLAWLLCTSVQNVTDTVLVSFQIRKLVDNEVLDLQNGVYFPGHFIELNLELFVLKFHLIKLFNSYQLFMDNLCRTVAFGFMTLIDIPSSWIGIPDLLTAFLSLNERSHTELILNVSIDLIQNVNLCL